MNRYKILFLIAALSASQGLMADPADSTSVEKQMSVEIGQLLDDPDFYLHEDVVANVTFTFNHGSSHNEIIVLRVDTTDDLVARYIIGRLNGQKIRTVGLLSRYQIPVKVASTNRH